METAGEAQARLVRRVRFRARHHYWIHAWEADENRRVFGDQSVSHAHDWCVEVHVVGAIDDATGWCVDLPALDDCLAGLMAGWRDGDLNAVVPEVAGGAMTPSTENLARWLFRRLDGALGPAIRVARVGVFESEELGSYYPGS